MSKTIDSASLVLRVMAALKGRTLTGVSNTELAKALGKSPSVINRATNTLIAEGFAIRLESGRFAPSIMLLQIAQAHANEMAKAKGRIEEIEQRVHAGAHH